MLNGHIQVWSSSYLSRISVQSMCQNDMNETPNKKYIMNLIVELSNRTQQTKDIGQNRKYAQFSCYKQVYTLFKYLLLSLCSDYGPTYTGCIIRSVYCVCVSICCPCN